MRKVKEILFQSPFILDCTFDNGERRYLNLEEILDRNQKYAKKIFEEDIFKTAKIGSLGQIYWQDIAEIKSCSGELIPCEYDISPELVYLKSKPIENIKK